MLKALARRVCREPDREPGIACTSSEWTWPDDIDATSLRRIAQVTLELFRQPERWIHRRVERIHFTDHQSVRRQISVDFTLPAGTPPVSDFNGHDIYTAPLFLLRKDHPRPFTDGDDILPTSLYSDVDLADASGQGRPLLTRRQNNRLAVVMLTLAASQATGSDPLPGDVEDDISDIVQLDLAGRHSALRKLLASSTSCSVRKALRESPSFVELVHTLATHTPVTCAFLDEAPSRSIVKLAYNELIDERASARSGRVRRSLGWKSELLFVRINEVGAAASYHVEVAVPDDLELNASGLIGTSYELGGKDPRQLTQQQRDYSILQVGHATVGTIYIADPPVSRSIGTTWVKLRAKRSGFLIGALGASAAITMVLSAMAYYANEVAQTDKSDGVVAALLLLPALVAAYIARPSDHAITSDMLIRARLALVINAALPFVAVLSLLVMNQDGGLVLDLGIVRAAFDLVSGTDASDTLQFRWAMLAAVSAVFTMLFIVSYITPRPHGGSKHRLGDRRVVGGSSL